MDNNFGPAMPNQPVSFGGNVPQPPMPAVANKNYVKALVLSSMFGTFGVDRFYLGYTVTGVIKLLTLGAGGIWTIIDLIRILFGNLKAKDSQQPLVAREEYKPFFTRIFVIYLVVYAVMVVVGVILTVAAIPALQKNARDNESANQSLQEQIDNLNDYTGSDYYNSYTN